MKFKYILGLITIIILAIIYFTYNPEMYTFFPECPFHKLIGLDCPGCGSQRAIHALLHGDVLKAADYNLLLVISLPLLMVHFLLEAISTFTTKNYRLKIWHKPITPILIFIVVLTFWIARNLPLEPFIYLAA